MWLTSVGRNHDADLAVLSGKSSGHGAVDGQEGDGREDGGLEEHLERFVGKLLET